MEVTVDKVGRVVIPKPLRASFGIGPDSKLRITEDGDGIRLEPVIKNERQIEEQNGLLVLLPPDSEHEPLTDDVVRYVRDNLQR